MNELDLENKLRKMRRLNPDDGVMASIKARVWNEIDFDKTAERTIWSAVQEWFAVPSYGFALASFAILILGTVFFFSSYPSLSPLISQFVIGLSSNKYISTQKELARAQANLKLVKTNSDIISHAAHLDRTHIFIASINLKGETGKYTREQCGQLYEEYEEYVEAYKKLIDTAILTSPDNKEQLNTILDKIDRYQNEAEKKW